MTVENDQLNEHVNESRTRSGLRETGDLLLGAHTGRF